MHKLGKSSLIICENTHEFQNKEFFGHKHFLTTQAKIGLSCPLFSKPRVCQSLSNMPNPAHSFVPLLVWLQPPLMRAVGTRSFWNMHSQSFE